MGSNAHLWRKKEYVVDAVLFLMFSENVVQNTSQIK
jgi:hypothetical protein